MQYTEYNQRILLVSSNTPAAIKNFFLKKAALKSIYGVFIASWVSFKCGGSAERQNINTDVQTILQTVENWEFSFQIFDNKTKNLVTDDDRHLWRRVQKIVHLCYATPTDNEKVEFSPQCRVNNQKRGTDCLLTQIKEFAMCSIILVSQVKGFIFLNS
jgi:hypothetical protein